MKIAIVQFPGSNCERETMMAVHRAGMEPVEFLWNEAHEKLREMDGYIIIGGFSYEDRSRAGVIAALDPIMQEIKIQSATGKPVLGICNGAQILVEAGLVPGIEGNQLGMVLTENKRVLDGKILGTGYYNAWVTMRLSDHYQRNAFTKHLNKKNYLSVPVAHGEGRFVMSPALWLEIESQGLNVFQYCDDNGEIIDRFPINPNGSLQNIAAISNKAGNVMAMMPHPERTSAGDAIFQSMRDYIAANVYHKEAPHLDYYPRPALISPFQKTHQAYECIIELIITDNHALTVQNTLRRLGHHVTVKRYVHWEILCDGQAAEQKETLEKIKKSGVLFNERKEMEVQPSKQGNGKTYQYLVRSKDDLQGPQKLQSLQDHFGVHNVNAIQHGVLWQFEGENANMADCIKSILNTNIIHNPYAHDCYQY